MSEIKQYHILLIEDDEDDYLIAMDLLDEIPYVKYKLDWVSNISDAKEILKEKTYDLFLCDFYLSGESGFDFLKYAQQEYPKIPVIMLTGQDDYEIDCQALQLGASDYLVKGQINPSILSRAIRYALEHKKAQEIIKESEAELRKSNVTKDKFFSIIAHDLRSPFTALLNLSNILLDDFEDLDDNTKKEYLGMLQQSSESTFKLIENLLQWSSIQRGIMENNPEEIRLNEAVNKTFDLLKNAAESKHISLLSDVPDDITVYADRNMVESVIRNITNNAIKFTNEDGCIEISAVSENDFATFTIKDNGIGMNETTMASLFQLEKTSSTKGTAGETGTGLGLMLCKEFVSLNNGELHVESKEGEGSTFIVKLPSRKVESG